MTDDHLIAACRELRELRNRLRVLGEREKLVAADIVGELADRGLDFYVFERDGTQVVREVPETREVNEQRFLAACRELELEPDSIAACFTRHISVIAARKLLNGQVAFDSLCDVRPGKPRVRIVAAE